MFWPTPNRLPLVNRCQRDNISGMSNSSSDLAWPVRNYQAIIFDCDGTLTDSMPVHYVAWHKTMSSYGIRFPENQFYALGGMPSDRIIRLLASEQSIVIDAVKAANEKELAFLECLHFLEPIEAVTDVANHFRGKIPMAVASGGLREIILKQLTQIGCHGWFDTVVAAEDTVRHKPHPDVFLEAARRLGIPAHECLVYEDSDLGIEAAKAASMDFIDVRTFYQPRRIPVAG